WIGMGVVPELLQPLSKLDDRPQRLVLIECGLEAAAPLLAEHLGVAHQELRETGGRPSTDASGQIATHRAHDTARIVAQDVHPVREERLHGGGIHALARSNTGWTRCD